MIKCITISLFLFIGCVATSETLQAQQSTVDTFHITVVEKTPAHPLFGIGSARGYAVNGVEGDTLIVVRNKLYVFDVSVADKELSFSFYTEPIGGTKDFYNSEFIESANGSGSIRNVRADKTTRDTVYYASTDEPWVGGTILVVDSLPTSNVTERRQSMLAGESRAIPNPCVERATIEFSLEHPSVVSLELVDLLGRRVIFHAGGAMESGERGISIDTERIESGLYHYRVIAVSEDREEVLTGRLQVLK
ncbi:MAG: hypothetical protein KDD67_16295 [Ignavibacteriae bacterium]|nr:hypothetical protein [Ignavibacteriota bacterium]MCB9217293.1 hypothetical protein [Ignavibacteria bacterium]